MKAKKFPDGSVDVDLEGTPAIVDFEVTIFDTVSPVDKLAREVIAELNDWPADDIDIESIRPVIDSESYGRGTRTAGFSISNRKTVIEGKYIPDTK